jgi:hypothetical protein
MGREARTIIEPPKPVLSESKGAERFELDRINRIYKIKNNK